MPQQLREIRLVLLQEMEILDERLTEMVKGGSSGSQIEKNSGFEIKPITEIPFTAIKLTGNDPIVSMMQTTEFELAVTFFADNPSAARSLVSPQSQAILYSMVRLLKPERVIEIGTFMAATTEAIARGLLANGSGTLDTIDPFGAKRVRSILAYWPQELRQTTVFRAVNSMQFFAEWEREQPVDLIFIDGNHDFEFALFDIESAGRFLRPSGFIVIDNITQPGPFMASRDFLARHRGWREHGNILGRVNQRAPFDADRVKINDSDFCILQAPPSIIVDGRPMTPGEMPFTKSLGGLQIELANSAAGTLNVQCVIRRFGHPPTEFMLEKSIEIKSGQMTIRIPLEVASTGTLDARQTAEPWLVWEGSEPLRLSSWPKIF
jgi:predicted O-methyltransferase YrrM